MSKKSRKRNKRILGALAALGTGLALANRGKGMEMSNISVDSGRGSGLRPTVDDKTTTAKVFQDDIMRGGSGVKFMPKRNPKSIRVEGEPISPFGFMFKKGGRVKKGFAKKKKQANKMRKK